MTEELPQETIDLRFKHQGLVQDAIDDFIQARSMLDFAVREAKKEGAIVHDHFDVNVDGHDYILDIIEYQLDR